MFKKALQIATAFGVLLASYAGYVHVFALVARGISQSSQAFVPIPRKESDTQRLAHALALQAFGPGHWSTSEETIFRLYNAQRGFWMYFRDYDRRKDGKQIVFSPFAALWPKEDGHGLRWVVSDRAIVDLDQPFDLALSPGSSNSLRVVHARIEGNVHLQDDKGTPNRADDLRIGPMTYLEYDEATLQVTSDSDVTIQDDVYKITGDGLVIILRPKEDDGLEHPEGRPTGFSDAQTAYLRKNVEVEIYDVGAGGILPGTATETQRRPGEPTPLHVHSDGPMQVDLPKRQHAADVGPPAPSGPTIVQFSRNVEVMRGKLDRQPDELYCDHLRLILVPPPKGTEATAAAEMAPLSLDVQVTEAAPVVPEAGTPAAAAGAKNPMSDLVLEEAHATGHNVRLISAAQGIKAGCNELIYRKLFPLKPDETYLRGDHRLVIEKVDLVTDGPKKGEVARFITIRSIDATIFDDHRGNDYSTIYARGPGDLESRPGPGLNGPIEQTARWDNELIIQPVAPPGAVLAAKPGAPLPPAHKQITLTGRPEFHDIPAKATLDARQKKSKIIVWLKPKASAAPPPPAQAIAEKPGPGAPVSVAKSEPVGAGSFEIERLYATDDVHLTTPGKTQVARSDLQAVFIPVDDPVPPAAAGSAAPKPAPGANPAPAAKAGETTPAPTAAPAAAPAPAPAEPAQPEARSIADRVWARVLLRPVPPDATKAADATTSAATAAGPGVFGGATGSERRSEIDVVRLRGGVAIHQDPIDGKARGTEIVGEAVDLFNQGGRGSKFIVYADDPKPQPAKAAGGLPEIAELFRDLAMVDTGEMVIRGKIIGLNQSIDYAWVDGNGSLTQMTPRGFLSDKKTTGNEKAAADPPRSSTRGNAPRASAREKDKDKDKEKDKADPKDATPMTIVFAGDPKTGKGMIFYGQVKNPFEPNGQLIARADFFNNVHAETEDAMIECAQVMRAYFDQSIKLIRPKTPAAEAQPDANADEPKPEEPKAEIAKIECIKDVLVINVKRDPITKDLLQKQRIEGEYLIYDRRSGDFRVPGEGMVWLYEREGAGGSQLVPGPGPGAGPAARPAEAPAQAPGAAPRRTIRQTSGPGSDEPLPIRRENPVVGRNESRTLVAPGTRTPAKKEQPRPKPLPGLVLTQIYFATEMNGRFGSGAEADKTETRRATFYGDVEAIRAKVNNANVTLDPDRRPLDSTFLTSQILRVISEPPTALDLEKDPNAPPRSFLRAWENAVASTDVRTIQADTITYDSLSSTFYAYGENGRDIVIQQQDQIGQPANVAPGRTLRYNTRTGESLIVDARTATMLNLKTGYRPAAVKPPKDEKPKFPNRKKFMNSRGSIERKDFTGH